MNENEKTIEYETGIAILSGEPQSMEMVAFIPNTKDCVAIIDPKNNTISYVNINLIKKIYECLHRSRKEVEKE